MRLLYARARTGICTKTMCLEDDAKFKGDDCCNIDIMVCCIDHSPNRRRALSGPLAGLYRKVKENSSVVRLVMRCLNHENRRSQSGLRIAADHNTQRSAVQLNQTPDGKYTHTPDELLDEIGTVSLIRCVVEVLHRLVRRQGTIIGCREPLILINQAYNSNMRRNRICAQSVWVATTVQGFMVQTHDVQHLGGHTTA